MSSRVPTALFPLLVVGLWACANASPAPVPAARAGCAAPCPAPVPVRRGLADLHVHQMASEAFGGDWLWGEPDGAPEQALAPCGGRRSDHGQIAGSEGGLLGVRKHASGGFPDFAGWPRWNTVSHQQTHADWLEQAHAQGLDLMVMSAVEQTDFCRMVSTDPEACDDRASVLAQLAGARAFAAAHPGWYAIVETPEEARAEIAAGRLAVVLGVEAGDVFYGPDPIARLDELAALGVRSFQIVHETDTRFAGAAWHDPPLLSLQILHLLRHPKERRAQRQARREREPVCLFAGGCTTAAARLSGFDLDDAGRNRRGLSESGRALVEAIFDRGLLLDVSHLSERAIAEAYAIARDRAWYPLFVSHGHFVDLEPEDVGEWSYSLDVWEQVGHTGGMVGVRSSSSLTRTYVDSGVANTCDGSSRSFAQRVAWASRELGLEVGFASDFGGLASNVSPRFGEDACAAAPRGARAGQQRRQGEAPGLLLDTRGFGHIGQIGELMAELEALGADTAPLTRSAEAFVAMWERAGTPKRGPVGVRLDQERARQSLR